MFRLVPFSLSAAVLVCGASAQAQLSFEDWRSSVFTPAQLADPAISSATADFDGDGLRTLQEYVFAGDPALADSSILPSHGLVADHLTLTFRERHDITGVNVRLQGSATLVHWVTYNSATEADREAFTGYDEVTLLDPVPVASSARRFIRLRISLDDPQTLRAPEAGAIQVVSPHVWSILWTDPNTAETGHAIERLRGLHTWERLGTTGADLSSWTHSLANYTESFTYRVLSQGGGVERASTPFSLPDTDLDGIPDLFELGDSYSGQSGYYGSHPDRFSSNGSGVSDGWLAANGFNPAADFDGQQDTDNDGLSDFEEFEFGTDPRNEDGDGDGVPDALDGWANVAALSPARLPLPQYVLVPIGPAQSYGQEINNAGHVLTLSNDGWLLYTNSSLLPLGSPANDYIDIYGLGESGSVLAKSTDKSWVKTLFGSWDELSIPQELIPQSEYLNSAFDGHTIEAESVGPDGTIYGLASSGFLTGGYNFIHGSYRWNGLTLNRIGDRIGHGYGEAEISGAGSGHTHWLSSYTENTSPFGNRLFFTDILSDGVTFSQIKVNQNNVALAVRSMINDYFTATYLWSQTVPQDAITGGSFTLDLSINFGSGASLEILNSINPLSYALTNRNTVILKTDAEATVLWLDTKAGPLNDQPVDANPELERLDWAYDFGAAPPLTLNAQMRGFDRTRIWQNTRWHDIADLTPATQGPTPAWSHISLHDQNDLGMLAGSARNTATQQTHAVLLLPVELKSEDRLLKGSIHIPEGATDFSLSLRSTAENGLDLGTFTGLEPGVIDSPTLIYPNEEAMLDDTELNDALSGTLDPRAINQPVIFYRDTENPRRLHFATAFDQTGEIELALSFGDGASPVTAKLTHTLVPQAEAAALIGTLDQRIESIDIPELLDFDLDLDGDGIPDGGPADLVTAAQPGTMDAPGPYVSEAAEDDPLNLVLLVNSDDDNADGVPDSLHSELDPADDDLAHIVLRAPASAGATGTLTLTHTGGPALRLRFPTGPPLASGTNLNLAALAGPLTGMAAGPLTLYAEGLVPAADLAITLSYTPDGETEPTISDTVRLTVLDPSALAALQTHHRYFVQNLGDLGGLAARTYAPNGSYRQYRLGLSPIGEHLPLKNRGLLAKLLVPLTGNLKFTGAYLHGMVDGFWLGLKGKGEDLAGIYIFLSEDGKLARAKAMLDPFNELYRTFKEVPASQIPGLMTNIASTLVRDLYSEAEAEMGWEPLLPTLDPFVMQYMHGIASGYIAQEVAVALIPIGGTAAVLTSKLGLTLRGAIAATKAGERYVLPVLDATVKASSKLMNAMRRIGRTREEMQNAVQATEKVKNINLPGGLKVPQVLDNVFTAKPQLRDDVLRIWQDGLPTGTTTSAMRFAHLQNDLARVLNHFGDLANFPDDAVKGFAHMQARLFKTGEDSISRVRDVEKLFGDLDTSGKRDALKESLIAYKRAVEIDPEAKFLIKNITAIQAQAYRYDSFTPQGGWANFSGSIPDRTEGWWCSFDFYDNKYIATDRLLLPLQTSAPIYRFEFSTLEIVNKARIGRGFNEQVTFFEPLTRDIPVDFIGGGTSMKGLGSQFKADGVPTLQRVIDMNTGLQVWPPL